MAVTNELIGAGMPALQASLLGDGNPVRSIYNGSGVLPASAAAGFEITSNYDGNGEVDIWNLVNNTDADQQGFSFKQKTASGTQKALASLFSGSTFNEFDLAGVGGSTLYFYADAISTSIGAVGSVPLDLGVGAAGTTVALSLTAAGRFILPISVTPSAANATGVAGTIAWDANFIYVCITTNTWKRVAIATWP